MNNTEKLLRVFIEASGYEVEEVLVNPRPLTCNDKPTNRMTYDYIDYKVTKKNSNVNIGYRKFKRCMRLLFDMDIGEDDFMAIIQLTSDNPVKAE